MKILFQNDFARGEITFPCFFFFFLTQFEVHQNDPEQVFEGGVFA